MKQNNVFRMESQKSVSNKGKRNEKPSKVLFVTIYDPILFELTNDLIFNTFNKYGKVIKVLIFQKAQNTKFFIQFASIQDSEKAKQNLQGTMLHNNYCKMHIFYSNLDYVDLKNKNTQGKDYSSIQTENNKEIKNNFAFFQNRKTEKKITDDFALYRSQQTLDFSKFKSRTDQGQLDKIINILRKQQMQNQQKEYQQKQFEKPVQKFEEQVISEFEKKITKKIHHENSEYKQSIVTTKKNTQFLSFSFQQKIPLIHVYNLFSNYGNIERIVMKNSCIFVQFQNVEFAVIAKDYLQNVTLNSNVLRLNYSHRSDTLQKTNEYSERINFDDSFKRFNSNKSISINPPSKILHISNIRQQITNVESLTSIFEEVAKVQKIQILTKSEEKNMALVKLLSMEDSVRILVNFHNKLIHDRKMQISFTKSKI